MRSRLSVKLRSENKYTAYLKLINGILDLTPRELNVLAAFMELNPNSPCSSEDRRTVKKNFDIVNVNVYVKMFKDRGLIKREGNAYKVSPLIVPPEKGVNIDIEWV